MKKIIFGGIILCPGFAYGLGSTCSSIMECRDGYTFNPITCMCEADGLIEICEESCDWTDVDGALGTQKGLCSLDLTGRGLCSIVTQYRCVAGYYGSPTADDLTCTPCPMAASGATSISHNLYPANTTITACYIPTGTALADDTGTYEFTTACYYAENE